MNDEISRAEAALRAERLPELIPIREAKVAFCRYTAACAPGYPGGEQVVEEAIRDTEAIVARIRNRSAAWFETRILLGHMLVGSVALVATRQPAQVVAGRLHRAAAIAAEVMEASDQQPWGPQWRRAAVSLAAEVAYARFGMLGDLETLQTAMDHADSLASWPGTPGVDEDFLVSLYLSYYEVTGHPEDLEKGIRLAQCWLADPNPHQVAEIKQALSSLLAYRVQERLSNELSPEERTSLTEDVTRAVRLAREAEAGRPDCTPLQKALAANTLGMALNAQSMVMRDPRLKGDAILAFMRALQLIGNYGAAGMLVTNNAATAMGQLAEAFPTLRIGDRAGTVLDDAILLLEEILELPCATSQTPSAGHWNPAEMLRTKFNYARLIILRASRGGVPADISRVMRAITDCTALLLPGHRQRAPALAIFAGTCLLKSAPEVDGGMLKDALDAALEAEAIAASDAPSARHHVEYLDAVLTRWRESGGPEADILDGRVRATRKLVDALPEYAVRLANRRALAALDDNDLGRAADYAEVAVAASGRALIVADDLDLAYRLAGTVGLADAVHRAAVAIACEAPDRAVMLLERTQANSISRLQLSLGVLEATPVRDHPSIRRCLAARNALRSLVKARRDGRISATAEALRTADQELEAATREVRGLPGMGQFLVEIADFTQLRALGAPCLFVVAGESAGVALLVGAEGPPQAIALPALNESEVAKRVESYLLAVTRFNAAGVDELGGFQQSLVAAKEWLEEAVFNRLRSNLQGERWNCIPCGLLCNLPWSAATAGELVAFMPSVQICARTQPTNAVNPYLLICEPEHEGSQELPGAAELHDWIEHLVGARVTMLRGAEAVPEAVLRAAATHQKIVFYAHGVVEADDPLRSGILLHGSSRLDMRTIMANPQVFMGRTVVLASCSQGRPDPNIPSQMLGPATAFLAAGARTVVAPGWPVETVSARIIATTLVEALHAGLPPEAALAAAHHRVRNAGSLGGEPPTIAGLRRGRPTASASSTDRSLGHPYFSGAFAVYGSVSH